MERAKATALNNCMLFMVLFALAASGMVLDDVLPRAGYDSGQDETYFLGIERNMWLELHDITGSIFLILMAIHVGLHKEYIKNLPMMINR